VLAPRLAAFDLWGTERVDFSDWRRMFTDFPPAKLVPACDLRDTPPRHRPDQPDAAGVPLVRHAARRSLGLVGARLQRLGIAGDAHAAALRGPL
jgi:hypothetical protein